MRPNPAALLPFALLLAACGSEPTNEPAADSAATTSAPVPTASATPAPAAKPIDLGTLSYNDIAGARLDGELGCNFKRGFGSEELWIGMADVLPDADAQGVIKIDGKVVDLSMDGTGGFNAMADGARFIAGDLAVAFVRTGSEPLVEELAIEMESSAFPTRMTVTRGGQTLAVEGVLECGP